MGRQRRDHGRAPRGSQRGRGLSRAGLPAGRVLLPLLEGCAVGSLAPADLRALGIRAVAVDLIELASGPGLARIDAVGGLTTFCGWDGPTLGIARVAATTPTTTGWRAHPLPQLLSGEAGVLRLLSGIDGSQLTVGIDELVGWAERHGVVVSAQLAGRGPVFSPWLEATAAAPPGELIVSSLAPGLAADGLHWDGAAWSTLDRAAGTGPLLPGCGCRACAVAGRPLLRHLRSSNEITASHLLTWHNLHWLRVLGEERPQMPWREAVSRA